VKERTCRGGLTHIRRLLCLATATQSKFFRLVEDLDSPLPKEDVSLPDPEDVFTPRQPASRDMLTRRNEEDLNGNPDSKIACATRSIVVAGS